MEQFKHLYKHTNGEDYFLKAQEKLKALYN